MLQPKPEFCEICNKQLHPEVARYSWNRFGKPLCITHQKMMRLRREPKNIAKFINKEVDKAPLKN